MEMEMEMEKEGLTTATQIQNHIITLDIQPP